MENKIVKIPNVPFYFVRHGQTDWNKENKIMGQIDIPLNEVGIKQAQIAANNIVNIEISHIVSSPLKRAQQTSEIIAAVLNKPITVIDELKQNYLGVWEGRNKEEFLNETDIENLFEHWKMGGDIEGAEHWSDFMSRVSVGLNKALNISNGKPILIVSHKPVYWAISQILNAKIVEIEAKNCGIYFFSSPTSNSNQWTVNTLAG